MTAKPRPFPKAENGFYHLRAASRPAGEPTATDIWIYDVIGDDWYDPSLTAKELCQKIMAIESDEIILHFNSPGGSVQDGIAIYNALTAHPAKKTSIVEGWTCSIATVIALAAESVQMFNNTMFMIHNPWGLMIGNASEMREYADYLDRVGALMAGIYQERTTKSPEELQAALDAETYLTAEEAAEWGFVDEVLSAKFAAAACDRSALEALGYRIPQDIAAALREAPPTLSEDIAETGGSPDAPASVGGSPERVFIAGGRLIALPDTPKGD